MLSTAELSHKEFTGVTLPEPYGQLLGKIPENTTGVIWGKKGSGKSTMAVDLAYVMANVFGKGIYCSSEEGPGPSMQNKIQRLKVEHDDLLVTDFDGLDDLKAAIRYSRAKFAILDSASMSYVKMSEFEDFHNWCKSQGVILFYILHANKEGNYKGNTLFVHMPDIEIKVEDGLAFTEKNRFEETPREMEVVFSRESGDGKRETGDGQKADGKRENPEIENKVLSAPKAVDESLLNGLEHIENPESEFRENEPVKPDEIYQMITDSIIEVIETEGELPWQKRYDTRYFAHSATNFVSDKPYRGINFIILNYFRWVKDGDTKKLIPYRWENPYFMTFNQVDEMGGKVKKGAVAQRAMFFTVLYKYEQADPELKFSTYDRDELIDWLQENRADISLLDTFSPAQIADQSTYPILKYYNLYNGEDIEGIEFGGELDTSRLSDEDKIKAAEAIWDNYPGKPTLVHDQQQPKYIPTQDTINMPKFGSYEEPQYYYSTLFHESVHSTGHKSRLNRESGRKFGDEKYAFEELIAEMGAAFLSAEAGILFRTRDQSAAYLKGWNGRLVEAMEDNNKFFFRASSRAQEAADFILDRNEDGVPGYLEDLDVSGSDEKESEPELVAERENPQTGSQCLVSANAKTNEEKNGIEIQFSDAPPEFIRDGLKEHGFTYYAPKDGESFWAAEKTPDRKSYIESIAGEFDSAVLGWKVKDSETADGKRETEDVESAKVKSEEPKSKSEKADGKSEPEGDFILGKETTVDFKADGSIQEQGHFAVMEVDDIIPSHNKDCSPNSDHKISKGQPRDRSIDALCQQPKFIAQNLNPTSITRGNLAFNGASSLIPDGQAIQGNGRGIALKIAKDEYPEKYRKYKNYLIGNASDWGFKKDQINNFSDPGLVRILPVSKDRAVELGNVVDTSQAKMSKVDQGKAYIRNLSKQKRQAIGNLIDDSKGETLGQVIDDVGLRIMDQIEDLDRQGLVESNSLTSEGKDFLRSVFAGLVFDSDENKQALQHFLNLKHTQKAGLERSYGNIIPFVGTKADITPAIQKAVEIVAQVQQSGGIDTVKDFMSQSDAFEGANTERFTEQEAKMAEFFLDADTQKAIRNAFRMYQWKVNGKEDLFNPIEKVSPDKAFDAAFVERERVNPPEELVTLYTPADFEKGDIVRDYYDDIKYKYTSKRKGTYYFENLNNGKKEKFTKDHKRFLPNREETPTRPLFGRPNPDRPLIYIGTTEQINVDTGNEVIGLEGEFPTFVSDNRLYIIPDHRVKKVKNAVDDEDAIKGFEEWHHYEADEVDMEIDWPDGYTKPVGTAKEIWYASDKIMREGDEKGKTNYYVHEFDAGKRPVVTKDDIVIVGNIEWNERGILN